MTDDNSRKINIGPMPTQTEDYSHYEESELRWDRIVLALAIIVALVYGLVALFASGDSSQSNEATSLEQAQPEELYPVVAQAPAAADVENVAEPVKQEPKNETSSSAQIEKPSLTTRNSPITKESNAIKQDADSDKVQELESNVVRPSKDPIEIVRDGIASAQLTSSLKEGLPVDSLGSQVAMNEEGIIKVVLYTEMSNLKGTWLRHIWYRNEVKQATIKVPVNYNEQRSSSSKFINAQMLGSWRVDVIDDQNRLYTQAKFEVGPY